MAKASKQAETKAEDKASAKAPEAAPKKAAEVESTMDKATAQAIVDEYRSFRYTEKPARLVAAEKVLMG